MFILSLSLYICMDDPTDLISSFNTHAHIIYQMSQADAINSREAEVNDWLQSVIDIPDSPHEEPGKLQRISRLLHENNEEYYKKYYTPILVSIGPIHYGNVDGQSMKDLKRKVVKQLASKIKDEVSIGEVYARVEEKLLSARNRYSCDIIESFQDDRKWCNMMFLDGCFVVDFICHCTLRNIKKNNRDLVIRDLLLYENQLPFEVLDALADACGCKERFDESLNQMSLEMSLMLTTSYITGPTFLNYFKYCLNTKFRGTRWEKKFNQFITRQWKEEARAPAHLLQYYLDLIIFFSLKKKDSYDDAMFVDKDGYVFANVDDDKRNLSIFGTRGAPRPPSKVTELKKVGIKCSGTTSLSDISFHSNMLSGKLFLPQLTFDRWRKTQILNLAAYEFSCSPKYRSFGISSYLSSMGTFIHGEEDVKELRARGLVQLNHRDDDDHTVVEFFRYITTHHEPNPIVIKGIQRQISTYCKSKRLLSLRVAYAEFNQRYFSGPWNFLVFLAVIFTVSMTIIQTVLTGIQTFTKD